VANDFDKPPGADLPTTAPPERSTSHRGQVGAMVRFDVDGNTFKSGVLVAGATVGIGDHLEASLSGLLGHNKGFEPELAVLLLKGVAKPVVFAGVPVFFADGARVGIHAGAGLALDPARAWGVLFRVAVTQFLNAPDGMTATVFVPSLGAQARF
jgi:hypothetical protein